MIGCEEKTDSDKKQEIVSFGEFQIGL